MSLWDIPRVLNVYLLWLIYLNPWMEQASLITVEAVMQRRQALKRFGAVSPVCLD